MKDYYPYPKRDPIKNYFPLPNEILNLGLSSGAFHTYAYLLSLEDRKTYQCWPSYTTIGEKIGKSKNSVRKYVQELVDKRLITTENTTVITKNGVKRNGTLMYTIRPIQEAIDYYNEVQWKKIELGLAQVRVAKAKEKMKSPPTIKLTKLSTTTDPPKTEEGPVLADFRGEEKIAG